MVVVSAPGKILLAGGYLILDENNCGLVVAVNRRFYCQCDAIVRTIAASSSSSSTSATADTSSSNTSSNTTIIVHSPQFATQWKYIWDGITLQSHANNTTSNAFIEKTLRVVLYYLTAEGMAITSHYNRLDLKLAADNDFYSLIPHLQHHHLELYEGDKLPRCLPVTKVVSNQNNTVVLKTGLGSSACLVTALVAAMVHTLLLPPSLENDNNTESESSTTTTTAASLSSSVPVSLERICALAQLSHCHAQGKVGSGFDVSAACYGSHVYQRFPPSILESVLSALEEQEDNNNNRNGTANDSTATTTTTTTTTATRNHHHHYHCQSLIQSVVNGNAKLLGYGVQRPVHSFQDDVSFLQVMLADVSMGSESPSMARTILQWKQQQQQQQNDNTNNSSSASRRSIPHWDDLAVLNSQIIHLLSQLDDQVQIISGGDGGGTYRSRFASLPASQWSSAVIQSESSESEAAGEIIIMITNLLLQLRQTFTDIRRHLKLLGEAAGVPVEPTVQTALCDATSQLPGVLTALVPGAGGYDAIACIYINERSVRQNVAQFWANYHDDGNKDDDYGVAVTTAVCALTVAGVDHGHGLLVEDQFPIL